jgi:hypothetical protein
MAAHDGSRDMNGGQKAPAREARMFRLVRFHCNGCTFPFQIHRNVHICCFPPFLFPYIVDSRRPFCRHIPGR